MNIAKQDNKAIRLPYQYIETEPYEKGFAAYYESHIVPLAGKYEAKREKNKIKNKINIIIAITAGLAGIATLSKASWLTSSHSSKSGKILLLPPIISWWFFVRRPKRKYFTALKEDVLPLVLKFMGDYKYAVSGGPLSYITKTHSEASVLFPYEDIISYEKNGTKCKIFESAFWDVVRYSGTIYLSFEFKKSVDFDFLIISKKIIQFSNNQSIGISAGLKKAQNNLLESRDFNANPILVSPKFDQYFELYTNKIELYDGITKKINDWLSDDFIDELIVLDNASNDRGIKFSIKYNQALVTLMNTKNSFEAGTSYNDLTVNAIDIKRLLKELYFTMNIVDIINKKILTLQVSAE